MKMFLSHSSKDKPLVSKVHKILNKSLTWFDAAEIDNGERIPDKICEGLEKCTHFVLFWSANAAKSNWVKAELNAAFVKMMSDNCKFMIFTLDKTKLPALLQPYKYDEYDILNNGVDTIADKICTIISNEITNVVSRHTFINRTAELGDIEDAIRDDDCRIIILTGILGIGKSALALRANEWIYGNTSDTIVIDFNRLPGLAELIIELFRKINEEIVDDNTSETNKQRNLEYALEKISYLKKSLILKDVKTWLDDDGYPNEILQIVFNKILQCDGFNELSVIITSSRHINIDIDMTKYIRTIKLKPLKTEHIERIIENNLLNSFTDFDKDKNKKFAEHLCGYPLGAKLAANNISVHGYDFYLNNKHKITELKIGLAKQLISYTQISSGCIELLKYMSLLKSKFKNEEYVLAGLVDSYESVGRYTEEAFFAGLVNIDDEGCYKLEHIVEDYYYNLACNDKNIRKKLVNVEKFIENTIQQPIDIVNKYRLLPVLIHIMVLNGHIDRAIGLRADLIETMNSSMWDLYNHREYDEAYDIASRILVEYPNNIDAKYMQALCCIRHEKYSEAKKIIITLQHDDMKNHRYYYALGRIEKHMEHYEDAISLFSEALKRKKRHCASLREIAECYYYLNDFSLAHKYVNSAKAIDEDNVWTILLECRILSKEGKPSVALDAINKESLLVDDPSQILFRKGRIFDEMNDAKHAIENYEEALISNPKQYDAQLCLLHHNIANGKINCMDKINELEKKLRGKRLYILMNIKARYIGYFGHNEDEALEILNKVEDKYIDQQWYAVKIQLLEKTIKKHIEAGRNIIASNFEKELKNLKKEVLDKYNLDEFSDKSLLPDT